MTRPLGVPLQHHGAYFMRAGESLVGMTPDQLRLLQSVRDEAHRFAQAYHHLLRRRKTLER